MALKRPIIPHSHLKEDKAPAFPVLVAPRRRTTHERPGKDPKWIPDKPSLSEQAGPVYIDHDRLHFHLESSVRSDVLSELGQRTPDKDMNNATTASQKESQVQADLLPGTWLVKPFTVYSVAGF